MLHYDPQHVSSSTLLILRRTNCITTASGIVTLCKQPYSMQVESGLSPLSTGRHTETGFLPSTSVFPCKYGIYVGKMTQRQVFLRVLRFSHVSKGFLVDKMAQRQVFLRVLRFSHVSRGFILDTLAQRQGFLRILRLSPVSIIPRELRTLSFIFQRYSVMVTDDNVVK